MADPRASETIRPEQIIVLEPGQTAPPVMVLLPNGGTVDMASLEGMSDDELDAWFANMEASLPGDVE